MMIRTQTLTAKITRERPSAQEYRDLVDSHEQQQKDLFAASAVLRENLGQVDIAAAQGRPDGQVGAADLRAAGGNPYCPEGIRDASRYVLDQPYAFLKLDTASGHSANGLITWQDLDETLSSGPEGTSLNQAALTLEKNFSTLDNAAQLAPGPDGLFSRSDLEATLFNPNVPAELRKASLAVLGTTGVLETLEKAAGLGECDGLVGMADIKAFQEGLIAT